ncbi:MAG: hypothetical protein RIQ88_849, partial [Actinomycetota bacterium]
MESSAYQPPVRRSLSDEELDARVKLATSTHSGIEALMELLVAQESLRAQENAEIDAWVKRMEDEDSPQARQALAKFRGVDLPEEPVVEPIVTTPSDEPGLETVAEAKAEEPLEQPFSWFTKTVEEPEAVASEDSIEVVVEEVIEVAEVHSPVGTETIEDFEHLLSAASAEEELTALDQIKVKEETLSPNLIVPTDSDRNQKPIGQIWLWLGASATVIPLMLSWFLIHLGLSTTTIAIDLGIGYLLAGAVTAMSALAGKRSGLSTATISRAVFGVWGNSVPLSVLAITRVVLVATLFSSILFVSSGFDSRIPAFDQVLVQSSGLKISGGVAIAVALLLVAGFAAFFRANVTRIIFIILSSVSFLATVITLVLGTTFGSLTFVSPGSIGFVSRESLAGLAIVFAVVTLSFVAVAPNLSSAIPMRVRGYNLLLVSLLVHTIIPALFALYALLWFNRQVSWGNDSLLGIVSFMPSIAQITALISIVSFIVYFAALQIRTSVLEMMSLTRIAKFGAAFPLSLVLITLSSILISYQPTNQMTDYLSSLLGLVLVLSAAWIGMFVAD